MSRVTVTLRPGYLARSVALVACRVSPGARRWTIRAVDAVATFHPIRVDGDPVGTFASRRDALSLLASVGAPSSLWATPTARPYVRPAIGRAVARGGFECAA